MCIRDRLYAYHERKDVSSRTIEKNCKRDINYMYLLEGRKAPDHAAIARFRSKHFAKCARHFMAQMTKFLIKLEQVTTTEVFIDGTKIESAANRYTFVWRKAVTKHQARFLQKTALLVGDIIQRQELKPLWKKQVKKKHAVSYTHLDVYKRQGYLLCLHALCKHMISYETIGKCVSPPEVFFSDLSAYETLSLIHI